MLFLNFWELFRIKFVLLLMVSLILAITLRIVNFGLNMMLLKSTMYALNAILCTHMRNVQLLVSALLSNFITQVGVVKHCLKEIVSANGSRKSYPHKVFCLSRLSSSLQNLVLKPGVIEWKDLEDISGG